MREITMRDFLRTPKSFLPPPTEGIEITRRDGESFFIYPNVRQMSDNKEVMSDVVNTVPIENKLTDMVPEVMEGWCQGHFEKGVTYTLHLVNAYDENNNLTVSKKWMCPKCIERLANRGFGNYELL
jgi:hypothetical protein